MSKVTKGGKGGHQGVEEGLKRNWNLSSFLLLEMTQVLDQIAWIRCAYGNVLLKQRLFIKINFYNILYFVWVFIIIFIEPQMKDF